eukprot:GHVQ01009745.1.p1 GENE.GHVQ01009745.1~~GHVQ01009745.1.p1  ORF type:complete len:192 (-),score=23.65 GHVQ01009745.1:285-860(-)
MHTAMTASVVRFTPPSLRGGNSTEIIAERQSQVSQTEKNNLTVKVNPTTERMTARKICRIFGWHRHVWVLILSAVCLTLLSNTPTVVSTKDVVATPEGNSSKQKEESEELVLDPLTVKQSIVALTQGGMSSVVTGAVVGYFPGMYEVDLIKFSIWFGVFLLLCFLWDFLPSKWAKSIDDLWTEGLYLIPMD